MTLSFKDHFSSVSRLYQAHRPSYPEALFAYLSSLSTSKACAWDCGTGNGQAAVGLSRFFSQVIATDASKNQIAHAIAFPNIRYLVSSAEQTPIESESVDLITVAQALHWFDIEAFFKEANRVLKKSGILAVWSYGMLEIDPALDALIHSFAYEKLGPYWPEERKLVESKYAEIQFPFEALSPAKFEMQAKWKPGDLLAYIGTWSSVKKYAEENRINPVIALEKHLEEVWKAGYKLVNWPLTLKISCKQNT